LSEGFRRRLHEAALRFARRLSYRGAGTVEFLADPDRDSFYFLEMNARIQVEHPVTEAVTGVDLVAEQIAIASGSGLQLTQADVRSQGCAMECRVNAEDPDRDFQPSPGVVREVVWPSGPGIRVDTHIAAGSRIPPFYDSLIAKVIAHAPDRALTLARMQHAIAGASVTGVATNLSFHTRVLNDPEFQAGPVDTAFLVRLLERTSMKTADIARG
jgi:acetyl-CoA carboxylase biotin carboxylase subunit